jgi:hypothetical protein
MRVDEVESGGSAPVAEQARLDVCQRQWLAQQRIVEQVDLPDGEIVGRAPPAMQASQVLRLERRVGCGRSHVAETTRDETARLSASVPTRQALAIRPGAAGFPTGNGRARRSR